MNDACFGGFGVISIPLQEDLHRSKWLGFCGEGEIWGSVDALTTVVQ